MFFYKSTIRVFNSKSVWVTQRYIRYSCPHYQDSQPNYTEKINNHHSTFLLSITSALGSNLTTCIQGQKLTNEKHRKKEAEQAGRWSFASCDSSAGGCAAPAMVLLFLAYRVKLQHVRELTVISGKALLSKRIIKKKKVNLLG